MTGTGITYTTRNDETFTGYLTAPDGDDRLPGVLMITAIFGIDGEMQKLADAWAADGFVVSVPDIFWRVMPGPTADIQKAFARYEAFDVEQGYDDVEDLVAHLRAHPRCNGKVAVLGYCFGGRYAHVAAARFGANAAGAFHGTLIGKNLDETPNISCPISFHFGSDDPIAPMEEVAAIRAAYAGHPNAEIAVHEGVGHNFSMPDKHGYDAAAARASRDAVLRCFRSM